MDQLGYSSTFAAALSALEAGKRVTRTGWNRRNMFVYLVPPAAYPAQTDVAKAYFGDSAMVPYNAYFARKGVDGKVSVWLPNVTDLLADDWQVVA